MLCGHACMLPMIICHHAVITNLQGCSLDCATYQPTRAGYSYQHRRFWNGLEQHIESCGVALRWVLKRPVCQRSTLFLLGASYCTRFARNLAATGVD